MVIWRIVDGRPGHDNQSRGLADALCRLEPGSCHDIAARSLISGALHYLIKGFPPGARLPQPDLIIGAGHGTHLSVLCAQRAYDGKSVIIMRPSLPMRCFDYCLMPDHDQPRPGANIIVTRGAINTLRPSREHDNSLGLILIGGPSRHFRWNEQQLLEQIRMIVLRDANIMWQISDSLRTPLATSKALANLESTNMTYHSCHHTGTGWVAKQLARAGQVWVSADSMSMIYEALTSGAATGILPVPEKKPGKLTPGINTLITEGAVTPFSAWQNGRSLKPPPFVLDEALRCADILLQNIH